jgi:hypothetical protein
MPETLKVSRGWWPTPEQKLLLHATVSQGESARAAWEQWRAATDIDHLDPDSYRLFPLLYHNLQLWGVQDPQLNLFKGVYRKTWYQNRVLLSQAAEVLSMLHAAGMQTMLLKDTSLALSSYKDHGLRLLTTIDVLVPSHQAGDAIGELVRAGWKPWNRPLLMLSDGYFKICHRQRFSRENWNTVDLHWCVLPECDESSVNSKFWSQAVSITINQVATSALDPATLLLQVCSQGGVWNPIPSFLWVADGLIILQTAHEVIDWEHLSSLAQRCHLTLALRNSLQYLCAEFHGQIPPSILWQLQDVPVSVLEHRWYRARIHPSYRLLGSLPTQWYRHRFLLQRTKQKGLMRALVKFPEFLRVSQGRSNLWQVLKWVIHRGRQRIMGIVSRRNSNCSQWTEPL